MGLLRMLVACGLWLGAAAAPAGAQERLSTHELERLKPATADRVVKRDLQSILQPVGQIDSGMFRRLQGVGMVTRPFGTAFDGLCRRDAVRLSYAPALPPAESYERTPIEPYGISAEPWFHLSRAPEAVREKEHDGPVWRAECDRAGRDERANWFSAADDRAAVQGVNALKMTLAALAGGALTPAPCPSLSKSNADCSSKIQEIARVDLLSSVTIFEPEPGRAYFVLWFAGDARLTILVRRERYDALTPTAVESAGIEQFLVVT